VAIPLLHNDTAIGVLTATGAQPGAFSAADVAALDSMSRLVAALIGSHREVSRLLGELFDSDPSSSDHAKTEFLAELMIPGHADDSRLHTVLDTLMEPGGIQPVFQPIVDLHTRATVAMEGLCRFPRAPQLNTAEWFSCARRLRRGIDLEVTAVQSVLTASRLLPTDLPIAVNLSPLAALEPAVHAMLTAADRTLIVEITEHEPFPASLGEQLQPLRDNGIRLAIDDAGAGYASMAEILRLRPDIIKIDGQLTTDIDADPVRRALTYSLVRLAGEIGASTVAEAVETSAQHSALQATGVLLGQGYFFGKPIPAPHITLAPSEA
jgi:EAL domain-containing protein (putative c-di-GMP-specific phosphodiesterase class I)